MKRKQKEPVKASNIFQCTTCEGNPEFDNIPAFKEHLQTVHKLTEFKGKKSLTMHLDCADSYHSTYEWEIGELKFNQFTTDPRHKYELQWA